jgi:hypothetical protein
MSDTDHSSVVAAHNEKFGHIETAIRDIQSFNQKMIEVTSNQTASLERIHERLDDWNEQTKAIIGLGNSVEHMVRESKKTQETLEKIMDVIQDQHIRIRDIELKKYEERFKQVELQMDLERESCEVKLGLLKDKMIEMDGKAGKAALKYLDRVFTYLILGLVGFLLLAIGYYVKFKLGGP